MTLLMPLRWQARAADELSDGGHTRIPEGERQEQTRRTYTTSVPNPGTVPGTYSPECPMSCRLLLACPSQGALQRQDQSELTGHQLLP